MPINGESFERFKERHRLSRNEELYYRIKTVRMGENVAPVVCLNMRASEAAKCGLGRELASRLAQEKGCYITDRITGDYLNYYDEPAFAIDCEDDSELEPAIDRLRSLNGEFARMIDRIYNAFKPKSL